MRAGDRLDGRFEIVGVAGEGGMGTVYRAIDLHAGRTVAVKVLSAPGADDLSRFGHEAQIVGTFDHPNIVRYVGHGVADSGRAYLVLEWLAGEDLEQRLARGPISATDALRLARILSRALGFAHARGIVHRDVKPANVFLVGGRFESAKLLDFGIARAMDSPRQMTITGTAIGTPAYMAPEQARGERAADARADVFSLGCLLFECFAGAPPFVGSNVMAILTKVLFVDPPRLEEVRSDLPDALGDLLGRMMSKSAEARPRDGDEVARILESFTEASFAHAPRPPAPAEGPHSITSHEQRLLAVVMVAPAAGRQAKPDDPTVETDAVGKAEEIAGVIASFGAQYSPLANGSSVAVLLSSGSATDLALRAARFGLALRPHFPDLPIALALGRGVSSGRVPVGEVIDRAAMLVRRVALPDDGPQAQGAAIAVDDLAAGLLDERFDLGGDEGGLWLRGERDGAVEVRRLLGQPSPCVGRGWELSMLEDTFAECVADSIVRGVLLTGAAGMGKSRLLFELLRRLRNREEPCEVWIGRGDPIAVGAPFGVLGGALRRALGLVDGEPLKVRQRKLRARVLRHVQDDEAGELAEFLGEIVGVPFPDQASVQLRTARQDPTLMGDRTLRAFEDFVEAETRGRTVLLVLEDLQWGDAGSVRLVEAAMRHCRERRFFVLTLGRPELVRLFPSLGPASGFAQVSLGELPRRACEQLVRDVLGDRVTPERQAGIVARAGGNAFYLEELIRHVAAGRTEDLPDTILAMLQSRIEGLAPELRRILRAASILGTSFWSDAVALLMGVAPQAVELRDWMPVLLAEELVEHRTRSRFPGQEEYVFRQELLRDAAYAMLTECDRELGHRLAGEWLEAMGETEPLVLGEHLERGGEGARAAECLARAAAQALEGHDVDQTLALVDRARAASAGRASDSVRADIALLEAEAWRWKGDLGAAERAANEAIALFKRGSAAWFCAIDEALSASGRRGAYELAVGWQDQIEAAECELDAHDARALALCSACRQVFHAGGYEVADELIERVRGDIARQPPRDPRVLAEFYRLLGARARHRGDLAGDLENYRLALAEYERAGDARNGCNARVSVGFAFVEVGDHGRARAHLEGALRAAERMGLDVIATRARQNMGLVLAAQGSLSEARDLEARVVLDSHAQGNVRFEGWSRIYLAHILLQLGDSAGARAEAEHAATLLEVSPPARAGALSVLALACVALGRNEEAELHARGALVVLETFGGIEEFESLVWLAAVHSARACADDTSARERLSRARARIDERAAAIGDAAIREGFVSRVRENAELLRLAGELIDSSSENGTAA